MNISSMPTFAGSLFLDSSELKEVTSQKMRTRVQNRFNGILAEIPAAAIKSRHDNTIVHFDSHLLPADIRKKMKDLMDDVGNWPSTKDKNLLTYHA